MKLRTFIIGLIWAGFAALTPVGTILLDDLHTGAPMNWPQTRRLSLFNALVGVTAYWRKHLALLKFPPDVQQAMGLQASANATRAGGDEL